MNEKRLSRKVWRAAINRCTNPTDPDWKNYGGRGIKFSEDWLDFERFYADMGPRPYGYRLERRNNDLGYSKENCVWATCTTQTHNQRIRQDNTSGLKGVTRDSKSFKWYARGVHQKVYTNLYQGYDFFEACCARKSWENRVLNANT
jgi:hypothetical protein